jgi:AraC-like DNA-binding protein
MAMRKLLGTVCRISLAFLIVLTPIHAGAFDQGTGKENPKKIKEKNPEKIREERQLEAVREEPRIQKSEHRDYIIIDENKVPIRISEGIETPDNFLKTIRNNTYTGSNISVNFQDVDIKTVIKQFAVLLGYPLKINRRITGKISYKFENAPWNLVLSHFLRHHRLEILFDGEKLVIRQKKTIAWKNPIFLLLIAIPILLAIFFLSRHFLPKPRKKKSSPPLNLDPEKIDEITKRILFLFEVEKIYKDEDFSLKLLAEKLSLQPYLVSRIINKKLKKSFPNLLNHYRILEAKRMLTSDRETVNILHIAFEVGFKSKTSFNRIFKQAEGITPSEYRERHRY